MTSIGLVQKRAWAMMLACSTSLSDVPLVFVPVSLTTTMPLCTYHGLFVNILTYLLLLYVQ